MEQQSEENLIIAPFPFNQFMHKALFLTVIISFHIGLP